MVKEKDIQLIMLSIEAIQIERKRLARKGERRKNIQYNIRCADSCCSCNATSGNVLSSCDVGYR